MATYRWIADFLNGEFIISQWFDTPAETCLHGLLNRKFILINTGRHLDEFYMYYIENNWGHAIPYGGKFVFELCQLSDEY